MGKDEERARGVRVRSQARPLDPSKPLGRILWQSYQHHSIVPSHRRDPRGSDMLLRFHLAVPVGQLNGTYPLGHPKIPSQPGHTDNSQFFGIATFPTLPSRTTLPACRKTHLSTLRLLRDPGNAQTLSRLYTPLSPRGPREATYRYVQHPRTPKSRREGIAPNAHSRTLAFFKYNDRSIQRLRKTWLKLKEEDSGWPGHVDQDQHDSHLQTYEGKEGIALDPTKI